MLYCFTDGWVLSCGQLKKKFHRRKDVCFHLNIEIGTSTTIQWKGDCIWRHTMLLATQVPGAMSDTAGKQSSSLKVFLSCYIYPGSRSLSLSLVKFSSSLFMLLVVTSKSKLFQIQLYIGENYPGP